MPGRALFDRVVIVDWSAASAPKRGRDSIWMATAGGAGIAVENLATRSEAQDRIVGLLSDGLGTRTLLGVDFSLGYPVGTAEAVGLTGTSWRAMWELLESEIVDDRRNQNNRFRVAAALNRRVGNHPGPFWGRPRRHEIDSLTTMKPPESLPEWRTVERALRTSGWRPFSSWQLLGAGCVGSQTLVGLPVLERLRRAGGDRVHVWPFTTGLQAPSVDPGDVVVAEIWPSLVPIERCVDGSPIRDAAQVETLAAQFFGLDRRGQLGALFVPEVDRRAVPAVIAEEGWVLGASTAADRSVAMAATGG